ncbi:hypothetical protein [Heyndrickxia oleronia]|jgi:hypothetical protein|uniref:hypothetical protein n=1 Tax=Heyndrickxia oleronia TaxID=38875 RepID=UPI002432345A|nr:hypothetical protein [Heyndrickxia oleronia]MCI1591636.1 hypothetical protein [Heyndrickxia oleronia]MCI1612978.1 hypothetical protein [Heyndrickxia oleronia]MCI1744205.1 hypothetical protein [Heyndrickxia oleronia]MCI1760816.1 hypothetical protein [Heyndrickxia oleronia]
MKQTWSKWMVPMIGVLLVLAACTSQQGANNRQGVSNTDQPRNVSTNHDNFRNENVSTKLNQNVNEIPSVDRTKKLSTNENGNITNGLGSNVYSLIGSSGLHDGGISSHLESRLSGAGIPGVKVFVLDDTVILARAKHETTSNQYDDMQNQVLSGTHGESGTGKKRGINNKENYSDDNLDKAKKMMTDAFNGHVQILTITNTGAPALIDKIKANIQSDQPSYDKLTNDIQTLIKMTKEKS